MATDDTKVIPCDESAIPFKVVPVLAGGGTRLSAHIGVLQAFRDLNIRYQHIVGVSGGSIVAALSALGKTPAEMQKLACEKNFTQFKGRSVLRLLREGGLSSGNSFERWVEKETLSTTFRNVPCNLHIVATDVRTQAPVVFNRDTTPDLKVARAIRFSMGIPLIFTYKFYERKLLVDGSILAEDALRWDWAQDGTPVIFLRMRANSEVRAPIEQRFFPLPDYLRMLVRTFITSISREYVRDAYWAKTLIIETDEITPLEFNLSMSQKDRLYQMGYEQAMKYLPLKISGLTASPVLSQ
ncbi:MAG: patatin-like phospholipase family protein [Desulfuromonadales bacterium]